MCHLQVIYLTYTQTTIGNSYMALSKEGEKKKSHEQWKVITTLPNVDICRIGKMLVLVLGHYGSPPVF